MAIKLVEALRKVDTILQLEARHGAAIRALETEVDTLKDRVTRLEARDEVLIARAEGAAATAAAMATSFSMTDLARRIGALEATSGPALPGKRR